MLSQDQIRRVVAAVQAGDVVGVLCQTSSGVTLPPFLSGLPAMLWFGTRCRVPIPDLVCNSAGIGGTLHWTLFGYGYCYIPWRCVTMVEGPGWVIQGTARTPDPQTHSESWIESLVAAAKAVLGAPREESTGTHKLPAPAAGRPHLRLIQGGRK